MRWICVLVFSLCAVPAQSQSVRSLIGDGNEKYEDGKFDDAEISYRKALEEEQGLMEGHFNLGNALNKQRKFDQSAHEFETAATTAKEKEAQASAYYNLGNTFTEAGQYKEAIKAYAESLKRDPMNADAKYNLSYALRKLQEQKQQDNQKQNQQDQKPQQDQKDKSQQQQNEQQQNKQQQEQKQQQSENQQRNQEKQQDAQQQQARPNQMSKADAERILDVVKNNEKEVQKKIQVRPRRRTRTERDW